MTCDDDMQAHIIKGALANAGIDSMLQNENMSTLLRGVIQNVSGVDILVFESDYDAAKQLLEESGMIPEQQKYCPYCGSDDIRLVLRKGKGIRAFFAAIFSLLAVAPPGTNHWEYLCKHCGQRFDVPVATSHQ
jgi:DNA-directed RNA polymerase subunit RPC12/RpoP